MLLELDLGFSSLVVLVACVVFPLIGLVLRNKWRRSAARKEEIRRLMTLTSEETAGAELEASAGYGYNYGYAHGDGYGDGYGAVSAPQGNYCAFCYSPTTTRCAICKLFTTGRLTMYILLYRFLFLFEFFCPKLC